MAHLSRNEWERIQGGPHQPTDVKALKELEERTNGGEKITVAGAFGDDATYGLTFENGKPELKKLGPSAQE